MRACVVTLACVLFGAPDGRAQDIVSGPEKGGKVPGLSVFDVTGAFKEKTVDYAAERGEKPTIYLLLRSDRFDRPMNRFMKTLDQAVKKDFADTLVVAVWLTEDLDRAKEYLPRVQTSVQYEVTALTCTKEKTGPQGWNVNEDAHLTAVVAGKGKVAATFGYNSINETDVKGVVEALKKAREAK
jgi:hypothetical protein